MPPKAKAAVENAMIKDLDLVKVGKMIDARQRKDLSPGVRASGGNSGEVGRVIHDGEQALLLPTVVLKPGNLIRAVPSLRAVHRVVNQRACMSWRELMQNTVRLGTDNPVLLIFVRDLEKQAEQAFKQHRKKEASALRAKRARVKDVLQKGGRHIISGRALIVDARGKVHKKHPKFRIVLREPLSNRGDIIDY